MGAKNVGNNSGGRALPKMDPGDLEGGPKSQTPESKYFCEERKRLLDAFGIAVQELVMLQEQQFQAVVKGDVTANRFDLLIDDANDKKQNAKYAYMTHLQQHGCALIDKAD